MNSGDPRLEACTPAASAAKKPYEAPGISWSEETEIRANLAAACGKVNNLDCSSSPGGS
jgi:hypothetical protein